jgi:hypothetical protein
MLRLLMSWCVPARALRIHTNFMDASSRSDIATAKQHV